MTYKPWERAIPETAKCPLLEHRMLGGEPFCSKAGEYPMLSNDCNNYKDCKYFRGEVKDE